MPMGVPANPVVCPTCVGMASYHNPTFQGLKRQNNPECFVCHGTGWIDLGLVCYCGRAATFFDPTLKLWYCGEVACEPAKHPLQNRQRAGLEPPPVERYNVGCGADNDFGCWY